MREWSFVLALLQLQRFEFFRHVLSMCPHCSHCVWISTSESQEEIRWRIPVRINSVPVSNSVSKKIDYSSLTTQHWAGCTWLCVSSRVNSMIGQRFCTVFLSLPVHFSWMSDQEIGQTLPQQAKAVEGRGATQRERDWDFAKDPRQKRWRKVKKVLEHKGIAIQTVHPSFPSASRIMALHLRGKLFMPWKVTYKVALYLVSLGLLGCIPCWPLFLCLNSGLIFSELVSALVTTLRIVTLDLKIKALLL